MRGGRTECVDDERIEGRVGDEAVSVGRRGVQLAAGREGERSAGSLPSQSNAPSVSGRERKSDYEDKPFVTSEDLRRSVSPSVPLQESLKCGREARCVCGTVVFLTVKKKKIPCRTNCRCCCLSWKKSRPVRG